MNKATRQYKVMENLFGKPGSHLRFRGDWLCRAGFHPGMIFEVSNPQAGVLELRVNSMAQLKAEDFRQVMAGFERIGV